ncbi:MAG: hypothetical protein ABSA45_11450 [Verrucomicrobiota bacterium]|jgi:hypothetical protein
MMTTTLAARKQPRHKIARSAESISQLPKSMSLKTLKDLSDAYARFCGLLTLAEEHAAAGDDAAAVGLAQIAARYTFAGYVGLFGSYRLERLLLELGKRIPSAPPCGARRRDGTSRNILHVLSYGRPVGGDSRCAWRWIQEDCNNRHSVVITTQADVKGIYDIPEVLRTAAEHSGGFLRVLQAPTTRHLEQARELRMLCREMDIVVLHLFPYDIVPVLALAADCDSVKTIFVNHADHAFWVGASVAHLVVHLRRQPPHFSEKRRGLDPDRSAILPIPMVHSPPSLTRVQAKRALGYEADTVLLLTIASPFKYSAPGRVSFLDLVTPVIAKLPQAALIAVGPEAKGAWRAASIQTGGRIVPLGTRWDNDLLYAAADVYLDSVPFSSTTSLLEAGIQGVPLLGYCLPEAELALLGPGAPGFEETMELANDAESYRASLTRLINDAEFRRQSGQRIQSQILSLHTGRNWIQAVNELYARVERTDGRGCLLGNNDAFEASALNVALVQLYGHVRTRKMIGKYIGALPYRSRLPITWRLHGKGFELCFLNLLPTPADVIVRRAGRWARKILRRFLRFS